MATSDTNRGQLRFSAETVWGETPSTPTTTEARITSESLQHQKDTRVSQIIISDRQRADILEVGVNATGDIGYELSYADWEPFFESALYNTITSTLVAQASTTFAASTITGAAGTDYSNLLTDQWIKISANGNANDGAVVKLTAVTSTVLTVTGSTLTVGVASANVIGRNLRNGTTEKSFFIETDFSDITAHKYFTGMVVSQMSMDAQTDEIVTGTFSFLGEGGTVSSVTVASTVITSAGTNTPMTGTANVINLREGEAALSEAVQAVNITINNNLRALRKIGSKPAFGLGVGGVDVTGTTSMYFENITHYQKFINHTDTSMSFAFNDVNGNKVIVTVPSLYYTAGDPQLTGIDADVFLNLTWQARKDPTHGYSVQFDFLPA
jgi:hypothetical protein